MDTRETVTRLLERIALGDPEKIAELYADHVDWKLDWPPGDHSRSVPWIRDRSTRAGVAEHFRLIGEHHVAGRSSAEIEAVLVDGPDAVVLGELRNTAKPTGRSYVAAFALHLTVEHGVITRHHVYEDSLAVWDAFQPGGPRGTG
ncbi:nuclear transport factor 2 family protein [Pseudonocardia xinjiangensis]|uniref:nuclear transport factor 2 family protein n=1 Tax=Pseudonocardia xinjiangensis TaxID=75289 RepID=UPI003D93A86C